MKTIKNSLVIRIIRYILIWNKIRSYEVGRIFAGSISVDQNYYQAMDFFGKQLTDLNLSEKITNRIDIYFIKNICLNLELASSSTEV